MSSDSEGGEVHKLNETLNCASTAFGLKLPSPAGCTHKQVPNFLRLQVLTEERTQNEPGAPSCSQEQEKKKRKPDVEYEYDFKSGARKSYRPFVIRDKWAMLERQIRLTEIEDPLPAVKMPLVSLEELKNHLHGNFGFERSKDLTFSINEDSSSQCHAEIKSFIAEVERTRILAISIGGHNLDEGKPSCPEVKKEELKSDISFVAFSGIILKFSDILVMPEELRYILSDFGYAKLSSSPDLDCQLLQKYGIRLRGWIHSGAVYHALLNTESKFDIQTQANFLESNEYVTASPRCGFSPYDYSWVPVATTLASAINFAVKRGYPEDKQMFPVVWEALDLTRLRVPEDLVELSKDPVENWMSGMNCNEVDDHKNVNQPASLQFFRRVTADFVEVFDQAYNPKEAAVHPYELFFDPNKRKTVLPVGKRFKNTTMYTLMKNHCVNCGCEKHTFEKCPELGGKSPECHYPHDSATDLQDHSILFCPVLHQFCGICTGKGHLKSVHESKMFTVRELRERYFRHAHLGYTTSIAFLALIPEVQSRICSGHFKGGFSGQSFRNDAITRYQLGIGTEGPSVYAGPLEGWEDRDEILAVKKDLIKKNAAADDPKDMVPIPKNINQEVLKKRNQLRKTVGTFVGNASSLVV